MPLGEKIRQLREEHHLTQEELAALLAIPKSAISKYENEKAKPNADTIQKMAREFNVTTDYLLGSETDETDLLIEALAKKTKQGPLQWNDFILDKTHHILDPSLEDALSDFLKKSTIDNIFRLYEIYYTLHQKDCYFILYSSNKSYFLFGEYACDTGRFEAPMVYFVSSHEKNFNSLIDIATKNKQAYRKDKIHQMIKCLNSL